MKTEIWIKTRYISEDGRSFTNKQACAQHEEEIKKGLPDAYQAFMDMLTREYQSINLTNGYVNGMYLNKPYILKNKVTSRDIKAYVSNAERALFWQIVTPTKENYEIIKKIHRFQDVPEFQLPYSSYNTNPQQVKYRFEYSEVYTLFYEVFFSKAWHKKNPSAALNRIISTKNKIEEKKITLIKS